MDRDPWLVACIGGLAYGLVFVLGVIAVSIAHHDLLPALLAIAAAGLSYMCFCVQIMVPRWRMIAIVFSISSILFGIAAGAALITSALLTG